MIQVSHQSQIFCSILSLGGTFRKQYGQNILQTEKSVKWIPPTPANYHCFISLITTVTKANIPRWYRKAFTTSWMPESVALLQQYKVNRKLDTAKALLLSFDWARRKRWCDTVEALDFTKSIWKAWCLLHTLLEQHLQPINLLQVSPDATAWQLIASSKVPVDKSTQAQSPHRTL